MAELTYTYELIGGPGDGMTVEVPVWKFLPPVSFDDDAVIHTYVQTDERPGRLLDSGIMVPSDD